MLLHLAALVAAASACPFQSGASVQRSAQWEHGMEDGGAGTVGFVAGLPPQCDQPLLPPGWCGVFWPSTSPCGNLPGDVCARQRCLQYAYPPAMLQPAAASPSATPFPHPDTAWVAYFDLRASPLP